MSLSSRLLGAAEANILRIESGQRQDVKPASLAQGTEIEVRDLFYATPARLKFLKADRTETAEAADVVRRLALAHPATGFSFVTEERRMIDAPAGETREARVARIMGSEFRENAVAFMGEREKVTVQGFAGLPTYSRAQGNMQFAFVNGRPVRDKLIAGAIRGAYADLMSRARFPALVLFLTCPPDRVDVNVHPAKSEVRFRDSAFVRGLIVSTIFKSLSAAYLIVPFLVIPQIILSGITIPFDRMNHRLANPEVVPVIGIVSPSMWGMEALLVHQFKNNAYERHFFEIDMAESQSRIQSQYLIPKLFQLVIGDIILYPIFIVNLSTSSSSG